MITVLVRVYDEQEKFGYSEQKRFWYISSP